MLGCMCQLLLGYVRQQREPSCVGMGGKNWLSARGHREPDTGSAGQMLGEVVISKQRVWLKLFRSVCKASLATSLPGQVKPEQVAVLGKTFANWRGAAAARARRLRSAVLGWKPLAIGMRWYLYNGWLYKMQKLTLRMGHQLILANKIHTLPTGTVGQRASLLMAA